MSSIIRYGFQKIKHHTQHAFLKQTKASLELLTPLLPKCWGYRYASMPTTVSCQNNILEGPKKQEFSVILPPRGQCQTATLSFLK